MQTLANLPIVSRNVRAHVAKIKIYNVRKKPPDTFFYDKIKSNDDVSRLCTLGSIGELRKSFIRRYIVYVLRFRENIDMF